VKKPSINLATVLAFSILVGPQINCLKITEFDAKRGVVLGLRLKNDYLWQDY